MRLIQKQQKVLSYTIELTYTEMCLLILSLNITTGYNEFSNELFTKFIEECNIDYISAEKESRMYIKDKFK